MTFQQYWFQWTSRTWITLLRWLKVKVAAKSEHSTNFYNETCKVECTFENIFVGNTINVGKAQVFEYSRRFSSHEYLDFDCLLHFEWLFQSQNTDLVSLKNYVVTKRALRVVKLCLYQFIWVSERVKYGIEYELQSKLWCLWSSQSCTRSTTYSTKFRIFCSVENFHGNIFSFAC